MRIAHISDLHILDLEGVKPWDFGFKRVSGGVNLLLKRSKAHAIEPIECALREIDHHDVDHIVVTGDLTNLAFDSEFRAARSLIERAGDGRRVSVIPGNHDYYTRSVVRAKRFEHYFGPWMKSDLPAVTGSVPYPYVKLFGSVAIVGLSSCIPTGPLFANGRVGSVQLSALAKLLEHPKVAESFVVTALHHHPVQPPTIKKTEWMRRLLDADELMRALKHGRVGLAVHGHTHQHSLTSHIHPSGDGFLHVAAAGSTSVVEHHNEVKAGKYNIYDIEPDASGRPALTTITTYIYRKGRGQFEEWRKRSFAP